MAMGMETGRGGHRTRTEVSSEAEGRIEIKGSSVSRS